MDVLPYGICVKMTLHIDDDLLARVMEATGAPTRTAAIDLALKEIDRRARLVKLAAEGLGVSGDTLREAVDPSYSLEDERKRETPVKYGRHTRSR
jgi:Arc/MetJ family transcription regulator